MAAALPAINPGQGLMGKSPSPAIQQHRIPVASSRSKGTATSDRRVVSVGSLARNRSQGKKERDLEQKRMYLRAEQPDLTKQETSQYRNTYKHNLCLDMLETGFHKSFAELFALIRRQNDQRDQAGPDSILWNQTLLENEQEKLDMLMQYLTQSETALRLENFTNVYNCQFQLAKYFQSTGDKWLADHFYSSCLATSSKVEGDEGKMAALGHCNVGLSLEESGEYFDAAQNFELFYNLCKGKDDWEMEDQTPMSAEACNNLTRIYTSIANDMDETEEMEQHLLYLQKAHDMAKEGGDRKLFGETSYRLGIANEKHGDSETALVYLNGYLEACRSADDSEGMGKACRAIAKSYDSQGKVEESIRYLEMFVEVAEKSKDEKAISRACSDLGAMFNSLGRYEQAVEYFNKSYNISRSLNDTETISSSRVLFGVAAGHKMLMDFANHVEFGNRPCMERLIEWKDNRGDKFDKPLPEEEPEPIATPQPKEQTPVPSEDGNTEQDDQEQAAEQQQTTEEQGTTEEKKEEEEQNTEQ